MELVKIDALMQALRLSEPDYTALERMTDQEWTATLSFCDTAHLTLAIAGLPDTHFPSWVAERLHRNVCDNSRRFERVKQTYLEAAKTLDAEGIEFIVIKGFTQSPDYVEDPRMRSQSDIDIFCPPENIGLARGALMKIGYHPYEGKTNVISADHDAALVRLGDWKWKGNLYDPEMPLSIELHYCLWNEEVSRIRVADTHLFWERRTKREIDGLAVYCLDPVDHLAHLSLHIVRNILLGEWIIHHVRELAFFLHTRADDEVFWRRWSVLQTMKLRSLTAIAFDYAHRWFACRLHEAARKDIHRLSPVVALWLDRFSHSAIEVMFQQNKDHLWLHISILARNRERWHVIRRTLIPARVAPLGSPMVNVRNKRRLASGGSHLWQQYAGYLTRRFVDHMQANISTLVRGLQWYVSYTLY